MTITPTNTQKKTDLLALTLPQLQQWLVERGEAPFRAKQIHSWLYKQLATDFSAMTNLPQTLRQQLAEEAAIGPMVVRSELHSKDDRPRKILLMLNCAEGINLGARHMTGSTGGLVPAIRKLSQEALQVNLAISLHAPTDELRSRTMPVNRKYPLRELLAACEDYITAT